MRLSVITIMIFIIFLSGCSQCKESRTRSGVTELGSNILKWEESNINSYVLTYRIGGGQLPPSLLTSNRVVVSSGAISQVEILDSGGNVVEQVPSERLGEFFTVEGLFTEISNLNNTVKDLSVQYDENTGLPSNISVDPNLGVDGCGDVSDDEYIITSQIEF